MMILLASADQPDRASGLRTVLSRQAPPRAVRTTRLPSAQEGDGFLLAFICSRLTCPALALRHAAPWCLRPADAVGATSRSAIVIIMQRLHENDVSGSARVDRLRSDSDTADKVNGGGHGSGHEGDFYLPPAGRPSPRLPWCP
jgi:hypothetical protein